MPQQPQAKLTSCSDCGLMQRLPPVAAGISAECARCGHTMTRASGGNTDIPLAFSASALLLLLPAALSPLLLLTSFGIQRGNRLPTGVEALWNDGFVSLSALVFLFSIAIPFIYLGLLVWVLAAVRIGATAGLGKLFRWAAQLRPWMMVEVYLVGCCVAYSRLQSIGTINIGLGGWCLIGATIAVVLAAVSLDERRVWDVLPPFVELSASARTVSCQVCELVVDAQREYSKCPRCQATLRARKPDAISRTLALVIAGFLLYLPANFLPVLNIERFGREEPNTILSGVRELISSGLWPLAVIVFTASIVVPLMKLFSLSMMLLLTRQHSRRWLIGRTRLFRVIDFIGRWSSIDLFMISILVALVRFGVLTNVHAEPGAVAFGAVIVVTMMASRSFDPRIMWDVAGSKP